MPNAFEALLAAISDPNDREALNGLAAKNPSLRDYVATPEERQRMTQVQEWHAANWDDEHEMPKNEWRLKQQVDDLNRLLAESRTAGDPMDLNELNAHLEQLTKDGKIATAETIKSQIEAIKSDASWLKPALENELKAREQNYSEYFNNMVNAQARFAVEIPYLNQKHMQEYGELFDPNEFLNKATEAKATDLRAFYQQFTADKAEAKRQADITAKIEAARKEERQKVLQEQALGNNGVNQNPASDGAPEMGHFQAKLMAQGTKQEGEGAKSPVPEGAELGRGQIARAAARAGDLAEAQGRVN